MARKRPPKKRARAPAARAAPPPPKQTSGSRVALAFGIAIAAAAALIGLAVLNRGGDDDSTPSPSGPALDLEGIPQDGKFLGSPDTRVTLIEYADLQCPACRAFGESVTPTIVDRYVRPGRVRMEFRGLAFIGEDSAKALRFVLAAGLQDRLWHLQDALYRNQGGENSGWVTDELLRELGDAIPALDVDQLFEDAESAEVTRQVQDDAATAGTNEVTGTPTVLIQVGDEEPQKLESGLGAEGISAALDDALAG
jgi:protein-disulfide isomerase